MTLPFTIFSASAPACSTDSDADPDPSAALATSIRSHNCCPTWGMAPRYLSLARLWVSNRSHTEGEFC